MKNRLFLTLAMLCLIVSAAFGQRQTVFQTSFEYGSDITDEPVVFEPADLDGADGQVGNWSGDEFPEAVGGDINIPPEASVGFVNNPYDGGRVLLVDRPGPNFDEENFVGTLNADLSDSILLLGAQVSFEIGTRRTNGNNNKDWDIVGIGSDGSESFRLRVGTNNNGGERLGYVTNDGADVVFDLPTVIGEDRAADLNNTGYNRNLEGPFPDILGGLDPNAEFPFVQLTLGADGYTVELSHQEQNTSADANSYQTALLPFNGNASDLAQVQFTYRGDSNTGLNTGWFLDNFSVTGFEELLQGDFTGDGSIGFDDFLLLTENFGTATSEGDFDFSGVVDLKDWIGFKAAYVAANGAAGEAASVPEPSSSILLLAGAMLGFAARRRQR